MVLLQTNHLQCLLHLMLLFDLMHLMLILDFGLLHQKEMLFIMFQIKVFMAIAIAIHQINLIIMLVITIISHRLN